MRNHQTVFQSGCTLTNNKGEFLLLHSLVEFSVAPILDFGHSDRCVVFYMFSFGFFCFVLNLFPIDNAFIVPEE